MINNISFTSSLYASNRVLQKAKPDTLKKINSYAYKTNSDIFLTSVDNSKQRKNDFKYFAITTNNGQLYYQTFKDSNTTNPITRDYTRTRIASKSPLENITMCEITNLENIKFKNKIAYLNDTDTPYSGLAYKKILKTEISWF